MCRAPRSRRCREGLERPVRDHLSEPHRSGSGSGRGDRALRGALRRPQQPVDDRRVRLRLGRHRPRPDQAASKSAHAFVHGQVTRWSPVRRRDAGDVLGADPLIACLARPRLQVASCECGRRQDCRGRCSHPVQERDRRTDRRDHRPAGTPRSPRRMARSGGLRHRVGDFRVGEGNRRPVPLWPSCGPDGEYQDVRETRRSARRFR
jgi:hypothetical protein